MTMAEAMAEGEKTYKAVCAACHGVAGEGGLGPALAGSAVALGPIEKHIDIIINGQPGTAMAAFGGQLSAKQIAAVTTYERNAWGNDVGDIAQPGDVKSQMQQ